MAIKTAGKAGMPRNTRLSEWRGYAEIAEKMLAAGKAAASAVLTGGVV
jgi:hypothetical protein